MADAGQHDSALLDMGFDAIAHFEESFGGLAHFTGTTGAEILWDAASLAEGVGRLRESQNGPDLVAQEENGDGQ